LTILKKKKERFKLGEEIRPRKGWGGKRGGTRGGEIRGLGSRKRRRFSAIRKLEKRQTPQGGEGVSCVFKGGNPHGGRKKLTDARGFKSEAGGHFFHGEEAS